MKKELKIEIPKGYEFDKFDEETCKITFKETPKDITERINNFEDVLEYHGIDEKEFFNKTCDMGDDTVAYEQLKLIVSCLNEGWTPNWNNPDEGKHCPYFWMDEFRLNGWLYYGSGSSVPAHLCFKSKKLGNHAVVKFESVYKRYFL